MSVIAQCGDGISLFHKTFEQRERGVYSSCGCGYCALCADSSNRGFAVDEALHSFCGECETLVVRESDDFPFAIEQYETYAACTFQGYGATIYCIAVVAGYVFVECGVASHFGAYCSSAIGF